MSEQERARAGSAASQDAVQTQDQIQDQAQAQPGPAEAPADEPSWMHSGDEEAAFEIAYGACGEDRPQTEADAGAGSAQHVQDGGEAAQDAAAAEAPAQEAQPQSAGSPGQAGQSDQAEQSDQANQAGQAGLDPSEASLPAPAGGAGHPSGDAEAGSAESALPAVSQSAPPAVSDDDGDEPEGEPEDGEGGRMSLIDHLKELRRRLCWCVVAAAIGFCACWTVVEPIFDILTQPLLAVLPAGSSAMYTTLPEAFFTRMFIAFMTGLFVVSPFIFYQIWAFISPGLYAEEKRFIIPVALVSAVFFVGGGLFCYFIVFHYAFQFFVSFATEQIVAMPKISDYLDFVIKLILAFGFIFEMPIFSFFLSRMGVVTAKRMRGFRRYAVLLVFIVAAILTPPDVVSQLLMAVPMLLLYEVSILVAAICGRKPKPEPAEGEDDGEEAEDAGKA